MVSPAAPMFPPSLSTLPLAPSVLQEEGRLASVRRRQTLKLLERFAEIIRTALGVDETILFATAALEAGGQILRSPLSFTSRSRFLVLTTQRVLVFNCTSLSRPGDIKQSLPRTRIRTATAGLLRFTLSLTDGTELRFIGPIPKMRQFAALLEEDVPEAASTEPAMEQLCPRCIRPVSGKPSETPACTYDDCGIPYRSVRTARRLSALLPGLGQVYLRNYAGGLPAVVLSVLLDTVLVFLLLLRSGDTVFEATDSVLAGAGILFLLGIRASSALQTGRMAGEGLRPRTYRPSDTVKTPRPSALNGSLSFLPFPAWLLLAIWVAVMAAPALLTLGRGRLAEAPDSPAVCAQLPVWGELVFTAADPHSALGSFPLPAVDGVLLADGRDRAEILRANPSRDIWERERLQPGDWTAIHGAQSLGESRFVTVHEGGGARVWARRPGGFWVGTVLPGSENVGEVAVLDAGRIALVDTENDRAHLAAENSEGVWETRALLPGKAVYAITATDQGRLILDGRHENGSMHVWEPGKSEPQPVRTVGAEPSGIAGLTPLRNGAFLAEHWSTHCVWRPEADRFAGSCFAEDHPWPNAHAVPAGDGRVLVADGAQINGTWILAAHVELWRLVEGAWTASGFPPDGWSSEIDIEQVLPDGSVVYASPCSDGTEVAVPDSNGHWTRFRLARDGDVGSYVSWQVFLDDRTVLESDSVRIRVYRRTER